jgi:hypothetical protein
MKAAIAYAKGSKILVRAQSRTAAGVWIEDGPCAVVPLDAPDEALGTAVMSGLSRSRARVQHPRSGADIVAPLVTAGDERSYDEFGRGARCVLVESEADYRLIPTKNASGKGGGFVDLSQAVIEMPASANEGELGKALRDAFGRCE